MPRPRLEFFFDCSSPWTYLAFHKIEVIAAEAGAELVPRPYRPVLRGLLLTGDAPLYLRNDLTGDGVLARPLRHAPSQTSRSPLWWPSEKIVGRYITSYLAARSG